MSYYLILILCKWCDREAIPFFEYLHMLKSWGRAKLCDRDDTIELLDEFDIYTLPYRLLTCGLGVIVPISYDELCLIRMGLTRDSRDPCDSDLRTR